MRPLRVVPALAAISLAACLAEPLDFPDWTIPVPEGTPIIEYPAVPIEARTERIELVEDLVIGPGAGDPNYNFYSILDLAIDAEQRIYVFDFPSRHIQVFDSGGRFLQTISRRGQGPGEIDEHGGWIAVIGDRLCRVSSRGRMSIWNLDGTHFRTLQIKGARYFRGGMAALGQSSIVTSLVLPPEGNGIQGSRAFVRVSDQGGEELRYATLPAQGNINLTRTDSGVLAVNTRIPVGEPQFAVSPDGVYLTPSVEYQVLAVEPSGDARWALRVAWSRRRLTSGDRERAMEIVRRRVPDARASEVDWPESYPALSVRSRSATTRGRDYPLRTDGNGYLYVFPFVHPDDASDYRPVDVYSPDGELLFAGMISDRSWLAAQGEYIYGVETDSDTKEQVVVRYRLVEPF
jgi:hypothetical protein